MPGTATLNLASEMRLLRARYSSYQNALLVASGEKGDMIPMASPCNTFPSLPTTGKIPRVQMHTI